MEQHTSVTSPATKIATAWVATVFTSWADVASFLAAVYTTMLIVEWLWKKCIRDACERRGWIRSRQRRREDRG